MTSPHPKKLLFICSRNRRRSLTAEKIFHATPGVEVRSAGTQPGSRVLVTEGLLGWADIIFVMEKSHLNRLQEKYQQILASKKIIALHIPDEFEFMQPELIDELEAKARPFFDEIDEATEP
jgi:predicted protein tyrosine phosphatase